MYTSRTSSTETMQTKVNTFENMFKKKQPTPLMKYDEI